MITSMIIVEGAKQIMLTPETEHEKEILELINPEDKNIEIVLKRGNFTDEYEHAKLQIQVENI